MLIFLAIIAGMSALAVILSVCLQESSPDAGFSAAMGGSGGGGGAGRKSATDELLEKVLKVGAIVWLVSCLLIAWLEAHPQIAGTLGS